MKSLIQEKPYNVRSITLRQVSSCQTKTFNCRCLMCTDYPFKRYVMQLLQRTRDLKASGRGYFGYCEAENH
jgi:hypothetical protein